MLDTGVYEQHQDLIANVLEAKGYNTVDNNENTSDLQGHGTHVAGTVAAAANIVGVVGSNPVAKILPVKVLNDEGFSTNFSVTDGVAYAINEGAKIINMSLGGTYPLNASSYNFYNSVYQNSDTLIVAAAGNDSRFTDGFYSNEPLEEIDGEFYINPVVDHYPSALPFYNILSVGSSNNNDGKSFFSNYGPGVDLFAPGSSILSTGNQYPNQYLFSSGTSMATPLVSGIASGLWSRYPSLTAIEVKSLLMNSVAQIDQLRNFSLSEGLVDMEKLHEEAEALLSSNNLRNNLNREISASSNKADEINLSTIQYEIHTDNIDSFTNDQLNNEYIGILSGGSKKIKKQSKLLKRLSGKNNHLISKADNIEFGEFAKNVALIDLETEEKLPRKQILKFLLNKKMFDGFDLNQKLNLPDPIESIDGTTTSLPEQFKAKDFNSITTTGEFDNIIKDSKKSNFIASGKGSDEIKAGKGNDLIIADNGNDEIYGHHGSDTLYGKNGKDIIRGGENIDYLYGGEDNDLLNGGAGRDIIKTGEGSDFIQITARDIVTDFDPKTDSIVLGDNKLLSINTSSNDLHILFNNNGRTNKMILEDVSRSEFTEEDPFVASMSKMNLWGNL